MFTTTTSQNLTINQHIQIAATVQYTREKIHIALGFMKGKKVGFGRKRLIRVESLLFELEEILREIYQDAFQKKTQWPLSGLYYLDLSHKCNLTCKTCLEDTPTPFSKQRTTLTLQEHDRLGTLIQSLADLFSFWESYFQNAFPGDPGPSQTCQELFNALTTTQYALEAALRKHEPNIPAAKCQRMYWRYRNPKYIYLNDSFPNLQPHATTINTFLGLVIPVSEEAS